MKKVYIGYMHEGWFKKRYMDWAHKVISGTVLKLKDRNETLFMPEILRKEEINTKHARFGYLYPVKVRITVEEI